VTLPACYRCSRQPCECADGITLYHADCRDILPHLEPVDLVLNDPPYGIGMAANPVRQAHELAAWDNEPIGSIALAMVKRAGNVVVVWGGNYYPVSPSSCWLVWDKEQPEKFSLAMCELAWTNMGTPAKLFRKRVLSYRKIHPTQKPVELMRWCIELSKTTGTILDPFTGSGTTLRAAKDLGRRAIGIEIEERYCEIAANRLRQGVLF